MKKKFLNNFVIASLVILGGVCLFSQSAQAEILQFKDQNNEPKNIFASFVDGKLPFNLGNFAPGMGTSTEVITITNGENYEIEVDFKVQKRNGSDILADNITVNLTNKSAHLSSLFNNYLSLTPVASGQSVPYDVSLFFDKEAGNECQNKFIEFDFVIKVSQEGSGEVDGNGNGEVDGNGENDGNGNGEVDGNGENGDESTVTFAGGRWSYGGETTPPGEETGEETEGLEEEKEAGIEPAVAGESTTAPEETSPTDDYHPGREFFTPGTGGGITGEGEEPDISSLISGWLPKWWRKILEEAETPAIGKGFLATVGTAWQSLNKPAFFSLLGIILTIVLSLVGLKIWRKRKGISGRGIRV